MKLTHRAAGVELLATKDTNWMVLSTGIAVVMDFGTGELEFASVSRHGQS
jgi:hypothetical protein